MTEAGQNATPRRAELDKGFQPCLAMNEYLVECEFLVFEVAGMPADPYTEDGLRCDEGSGIGRGEGRSAGRIGGEIRTPTD